MTTPTYFWLREEAWEKPLTLFLQKSRDASDTRLFAPPTHLRRGDPHELLRFFWILATPKKEPLGWAEAHLFRQRFVTYHLLIEIRDIEPQELVLAAVSLLISSIFITSNSDVIKLVAVNDALSTLLAAQNWGAMQAIWSPNAIGNLYLEEAGRTCTQHTLSAGEWWTSPNAKKDAETLKYLKMRKARLKE